MQNPYKRTNNNWLWVSILVKGAYPCTFYFRIKEFYSILCIIGKTWLSMVLHDFSLTYYSSIILGSFSILLFPKLCWHVGLTPTWCVLGVKPLCQWSWALFFSAIPIILPIMLTDFTYYSQNYACFNTHGISDG